MHMPGYQANRRPKRWSPAAVRICLCLILFWILSADLYGAGLLDSRYTTILYTDRNQLEAFTEEVYLGSLSYFLRRRSSITLQQEVADKVDTVVERVMEILEMFPKGMKFKIVFHDNKEEVREAYRKIYGFSPDFIAFYSPKTRTLHLSLEDISLRVLAHETAHAVIDHYFGIAPPSKVHEVLAQYVEENIEK
jgi:hypothetical protein